MADPWLPDPDANGSVPASRSGTPVLVYRLTPPGGPVTAATPLPNVACVAMEEHEGDTPATAVFRYRFADYGALFDPAGPNDAEQALSTASTTTAFPDLVEVGDRLGVQAVRPDGTTAWLFDGKVLAFNMRIDPETEAVAMTAVGIAKECWSDPVGGALIRHSHTPEVAKANVQTDLLAQFNPRGAPNASPSTGDAGLAGYTYPVFMDPGVTGADANGNAYPRTWELPMAAAHLLYLNNDGAFVANPTRAGLDALLVARQPIAGVPFDPNDPTTYTTGTFFAPDTPLTGKPWPSLLRNLVQDFGFGMSWPVSSDANGFPATRLNLFLKQAGTPKAVYLSPRGSQFSPATTNVHTADVSRDLAGVVNQWSVAGGLKRYEASFVLYPGFPSQASDAASPAINAFEQNDANFDAGVVSDAYRLWILDEAGELHYLPASTTPVTKTPTSLDAVLGAPVSGATVYAKRRRTPIGDLLSADGNGKTRKCRLSISKAYTGPYGVWDGTGTDWQHVQGGFELLKDRVGIRLRIQHPNKWDVGASKAAGAPFPSGVVKAVESTGNPGGANPAFFLRLTVVIEGDRAIGAVSGVRTSSPIQTAIAREVDARDRLVYHEVSAKSEFNSATTPLVLRDDTPACLAEATSLRTATEAGVMEGEVFIPRFTAYYAIGDRISGIEGRGLGFRTDTGPAGFQPVLPIVVSRRFQFEPRQGTTLTVSDAGLDRKRYSTQRGPVSAAARSYALNRRQAKGYAAAKREESALKARETGGNVH